MGKFIIPPGREKVTELGNHLDRWLAPSVGKSPHTLEEVDRLDWELWLLLTLVLLCLLMMFILNHAPGLLPQVEMILKPSILEVYTDGLTVLVLLFCLYVIQKHRQLKDTRTRLISARIEKEGLSQRLALVEVLYDISEEVTSKSDSREVYDRLIDRVRSIMDADVATLYLVERESGELVLEGSSEIALMSPEWITVGRGFPGWVALHKEPLLINRPFDAEGFHDLSDLENNLVSAIYVPLVVDGEMWGIMGVGSHSIENVYYDSDLKLLQVFGNSMVLWMRKNDLIAQLQESLKKNEETQLQLIQAEKLAGLGELMAGISHELNNPLSVVVGNTQLLMRQELPGDVMERLEKMNHEALRSKRLVENLLRAARGEGVEGEEVNLNEVIEQSLALLRYQVSLDNVILETSLQEDLPPSILDPFQIQQLIFNLVNNARQAMLATPKDQRVIHVLSDLQEEASSDGIGPEPSVHLQVRDTGPGIPEENIVRIFDPFFTTKEIGAGTGLGLSICYRIVKEFMGSITAGNHPEGGAVFDIWLPVHFEVEETSKETAATESEPKEPSRPGLILVVDDEENICELVEEVLGDAGHEVECASNGQEALDLLGEIERPNAIILDLKMPVMDGREFYLKLEEDDPNLAGRVFFLTGDTLSRDARSFLQNVDRPFMSKPFSLDELLDRIETSMEW